MSKFYYIRFSYFEYKKEKLSNEFSHNRLNDKNNSDNSIMRIAEAIIESGGTATK